MTRADRARWEARYTAGGDAQSEPIPLLEEALASAPATGRALDLACGRGRHAIALARRGYLVDAIDISPAALASARERAGDLPIRWREADLDDAAIEAGAYAVVVCVGFTDERLMPRLADALQRGGVLLYAARPRAICSFGPLPGAVARWFAGLEPLRMREDEDRVAFVGRRR